MVTVTWGESESAARRAEGWHLTAALLQHALVQWWYKNQGTHSILHWFYSIHMMNVMCVCFISATFNLNSCDGVKEKDCHSNNKMKHVWTTLVLEPVSTEPVREDRERKEHREHQESSFPSVLSQSELLYLSNVFLHRKLTWWWYITEGQEKSNNIQIMYTTVLLNNSQREMSPATDCIHVVSNNN